MVSKMMVILAALALLVIPTAAQTAPLWPMKVGQWMELDKHDNANPSHKWIVRMDVVEEVTLGGQKYFHVRQANYDGTGSIDDNYLRCTDTQVWGYNGAGETLFFQLTQTGTTWTYPEGSSTIYKTLVASEQIIIPYGGAYTAYKYEHHAKYQDGTTSPSCYEWIVPGLGYVQELDYWGENTMSVLARVGADPLFSLKTGMTLTYNSSNTNGQTWHMTQQVLEQVTLSGKQYFHVRETNFSPNGGVDWEGYLRSTDKAVYFYDGAGGEVIAFQVGDVGTTWTPRPGETDEIVDIVDVTVPYGGPFKAYVIRRVQADQPTAYDYEYLVPGLWSVKNTGNWETPAITHVLARITQRGVNPALNLLLD